MRVYFALIIFLLPFFTYSQFNEKNFEYLQIDSVPGTKAEVYTKARTFIASYFVSAKDVIQMDDKESGTIIAKGFFEIEGAKGGFGNHLGNDKIWVIITIDVKDNKYRCKISDFKHEGGNYKGAENGGPLVSENPSCGNFWMPKSRWKKFKERAKESAELLLKNLHYAMISANNKDF